MSRVVRRHTQLQQRLIQQISASLRVELFVVQQNGRVQRRGEAATVNWIWNPDEAWALLQTDRHLFLQRLYSRHSGHIGGSQPWTDAAGTHYTEVIQLRLYSAYRRLCDSRQHCATLSRDPAQTHWIVIRGRSRLWPQEMPVCNQSEFQLVYTVSKKRLNFETL